ncbi:putative armadillo-like helical protein [Arabidopsis thaliana]
MVVEENQNQMMASIAGDSTVTANISEEDEAEEETTTNTWKTTKELLILHLSKKLLHGDLDFRIEAAKEIRKLLRKSPVKSSARSKLADAGVIPPLVPMLFSSNVDARHASLLALLNLAVRNERNKIEIVKAGAVPPLIQILKLHNASLRELATAAILTLSAAPANKAMIISSGVPPLLIQMLSSGTVQGKVDAVTALHNLSACKEYSASILDAKAVYPLIHLLKECKKHSKFAEKATALVEMILSHSEDGRNAITSCEDGILTLVKTVEDGSPLSIEHAVGALLSLCRSDRDKYRKLILKEGAIPGLLSSTVDGTSKSRDRARVLLDLLRETPREKEMTPLTLEKIVYGIAVQVDGAEKAAETAKKLLQDMVHRSMELSMKSIQHKAASCASIPDISSKSNS